VARKPSLRGLGIAPREERGREAVWEEEHVVVGLRLEGMYGMGFVVGVDASRDGEEEENEDEDGDGWEMDEEARCWGDVGVYEGSEVWEPIRVVDGKVVRGWVEEMALLERRKKETECLGNEVEMEGSEFSEVDEDVLRGGTVGLETTGDAKNSGDVEMLDCIEVDASWLEWAGDSRRDSVTAHITPLSHPHPQLDGPSDNHSSPVPLWGLHQEATPGIDAAIREMIRTHI
jgi:hypothetical protein